MITKRIIPCLDVRNGRVVKGVNFEGLRDVDSPAALGKYYSDSGADELVFYDITASCEDRALFTDILTEVARTIFIPLTVGGGINSLDDFDRVLKCGADKVSVNSGAIRDPSLVREAARRYGDQCVVLSADIKRVDGVFRVFAKGGRENTGMEAIEWGALFLGEALGRSDLCRARRGGSRRRREGHPARIRAGRLRAAGSRPGQMPHGRRRAEGLL